MRLLIIYLIYTDIFSFIRNQSIVIVSVIVSLSSFEKEILKSSRLPPECEITCMLVVYTSEKRGDDESGDGSQEKPFKTIKKGVRESLEKNAEIFCDAKPNEQGAPSVCFLATLTDKISSSLENPKIVLVAYVMSSRA